MTSWEIGRSIGVRTAPRPTRPRSDPATLRVREALVRRSARGPPRRSPACGCGATTRSAGPLRPSIPFTSLMSIDAVAVDGITFDACAPTRELAMPRMLSDGSVISSLSDWPSPSVEPSQNSRISSRVDRRRLGEGLPLRSVRAARHRRRSRRSSTRPVVVSSSTRAGAPAAAPDWAPSCRSGRCAARSAGRRP